MMKRVYTTLLPAIMLLSAMTAGWGQLVGLDAAPYASRGQAMLPIHVVAEWLGAEAETDEAAATFTMQHGDIKLQLRAGEPHALVNGEQVPIDSRPAMGWSHVETRDGRPYVPMVFAAEALGIQARWNTTAGGFATLSRGDDDDNPAVLARSPMHWAAAEGNAEGVAMLLDAGVDVSTQCTSGWTALYWAAHNGHTEVARLLLDRGADVNAQDPTLRWAPLHHAGYRGRTETAALLLERGADPNIRNVWGEAPLHWAARRGRTETVEVLLEKGADPNAAENGGVTPLHQAASYGHAETVEMLIKHGADVSATSNCGQSVLYWATRWNRTAIVESLKQHGATR